VTELPAGATSCSNGYSYRRTGEPAAVARRAGGAGGTAAAAELVMQDEATGIKVAVSLMAVGYHGPARAWRKRR
jgi:hypothetical protein